MQFAARKVREESPGINVWSDRPSDHDFSTLLISHVLTELSDEHVAEILALAAHTTSVIWVEPGTYEVSRSLIAAREHLRGAFQVVAPCTHQATCGMLMSENNRHWCHQFAPSPPEAFTDGNWARLAKLAGVDLRSLPVSFLVLDKRPQSSQSNAARVIGRPRVYKAHALVLGCDESGINEHRYTKRDQPEEFRRFKKGDVPPYLPHRSDS
jgi:ribosomal protein RSM22 (predicted rRNA methylase)